MSSLKVPPLSLPSQLPSAPRRTSQDQAESSRFASGCGGAPPAALSFRSKSLSSVGMEYGHSLRRTSWSGAAILPNDPAQRSTQSSPRTRPSKDVRRPSKDKVVEGSAGVVGAPPAMVLHKPSSRYGRSLQQHQVDVGSPTNIAMPFSPQNGSQPGDTAASTNPFGWQFVPERSMGLANVNFAGVGAPTNPFGRQTPASAEADRCAGSPIISVRPGRLDVESSFRKNGGISSDRTSEDTWTFMIRGSPEWEQMFSQMERDIAEVSNHGVAKVNSLAFQDCLSASTPWLPPRAEKPYSEITLIANAVKICIGDDCCFR